MRYLDPTLPLALAFGLAALLIGLRSGKKPHWTFAVSITSLLVISSGPFASLFSQPLDHRYDRRSFADRGEAIVVLAGGCSGADQYRPYTSLSLETYSRLLSSVWVYRCQAPRPIVATGQRCAPAMAQLLQSEGIPQSLILQEGRATNTHENALYSAELLQAKKIRTVVLVTDAKSMLRAELCFRKVGLTVIPYPVGLGSFEFDFLDLLPKWQAIKANSDTLHEYMGLLMYRAAGWI